MPEPILVSPPAVEPLTLADVRLHLRIDPDNTSEDALLSQLIRAARRQAEQELGRRLVTQTWDMLLDAFPAGDEAIKLHPGLCKAQSIALIQYLDPLGATQTMPSAQYALDANELPGYVFTTGTNTWPTSVADSANCVRVRVVCGYGNAADVPDNVVAWIKLQIGALWANREAFATGVSVSELPARFTAALLDSERVYLSV